MLLKADDRLLVSGATLVWLREGAPPLREPEVPQAKEWLRVEEGFIKGMALFKAVTMLG